ncbi:MAG: toxic anion resistance protein [Bacilli bacterium]|nr:toxic anion resistance protein [Bacilli bacterium]
MNTKTMTIDATFVTNDEPTVVANNQIRLIDDNGIVDLSRLSDEDKSRYSKMNEVIKLGDINSIACYGTDLTNTMSKFNNEFLKAVRAPQSGEIGELINNLLGELSYIDVDELKTPTKIKKLMRKLPIVRGMVTSVDKLLRKYDSISANVDAIAAKISATRISTLRDNNDLQIMFDDNIVYGKQVEDLIIAAKIKQQEITEKLQYMSQHPEQFEAHEIQDVQEFNHTLEKRISEMMTLRFIIKQSLPQIRTIQYNNIAIADKANSIIATTIPVWKNQLSIAVALQNQQASIEAQRKVTEVTNTILKKNSELIHQNSIAVAQETERGVVEIETLRETTSKLIETISEVKRIHEEGASKRKQAEIDILKLENTLETSMHGIIKSIGKK